METDTVTDLTTDTTKDTTPNATATTKNFAKIASAAANRPDPAAVSKKLAKKRRIVGRMFTLAENKGSQGYQYVYIARSTKLLRSDIRKQLKDVGVDLGRILDICFPASTAVGFLLHVQYVEEFLELVTKQCDGTQLTKFDPLNPDNIAVPQYDDLPANERNALIYRFNETRCFQTLKFLRPLHVSSVGKFFVGQNWISQADLDKAVAAAAKRYAEKDPKRAKFFFRRKLSDSDSEDDDSDSDVNGSDMEQ